MPRRNFLTFPIRASRVIRSTSSSIRFLQMLPNQIAGCCSRQCNVSTRSPGVTDDMQPPSLNVSNSFPWVLSATSARVTHPIVGTSSSNPSSFSSQFVMVIQRGENGVWNPWFTGRDSCRVRSRRRDERDCPVPGLAHDIECSSGRHSRCVFARPFELAASDEGRCTPSRACSARLENASSLILIAPRRTGSFRGCHSRCRAFSLIPGYI